MLAGTVFNTLISTLQNNPTLSGYVKQVFKGMRYNIEPDSMPCIMCDVSGNFITEQDMNDYQKVYLNVELAAFVPLLQVRASYYQRPIKIHSTKISIFLDV